MNLAPPGSDNVHAVGSVTSSNHQITQVYEKAFQPGSVSGSLPERSPLVSDRKRPASTSRRSSQPRKKRQPWAKEEDELLFELVKKEAGYKPNWPQIAEAVNEAIDSCRTGKQCRERWQNHLRPDIKKGNWTLEEEEMIRNLKDSFGPKWSCMAKIMKNRTDNDIKNKWNSMQRSKELNRAKYGYNFDASKLSSPMPTSAPLSDVARYPIQSPEVRSSNIWAESESLRRNAYASPVDVGNGAKKPSIGEIAHAAFVSSCWESV